MGRTDVVLRGSAEVDPFIAIVGEVVVLGTLVAVEDAFVGEGVVSSFWEDPGGVVPPAWFGVVEALVGATELEGDEDALVAWVEFESVDPDGTTVDGASVVGLTGGCVVVGPSEDVWLAAIVVVWFPEAGETG